MMRNFLVLSFIFLLAGCAPQIGERLRPISESAVDSSIYVLCMAAPIGTVRARFGTTEESAQLYRDFCSTLDGYYDVMGY